jgi:hypothetical protein
MIKACCRGEKNQSQRDDKHLRAANDAAWKKSSVTETGSFWKVDCEAVATSETASSSEGAAAACLNWFRVAQCPERSRVRSLAWSQAV